MTNTGRGDFGHREAGGEPAAEPPRDTEELRKDIAHTRDELGATVEALAAKADVVTRAKERAQRTKTNVRDQTQHRLSAVRRKVGDVGQEGRHRADRLATRAKETAGPREGQSKGGRAGMIVAALATAVAAVVVVRRRRRRMSTATRILGTWPGGTRVTVRRPSRRRRNGEMPSMDAIRRAFARRSTTKAIDIRLGSGSGLTGRRRRTGYKRRYMM